MAQSLYLDPVLGGRSPRAIESDSFGQRLKRIRNLKGLTQEQLAEQLSLTELQIGRWERDEALPQAKNLAKLAAFFEVPEVWLTYGGDSGPATVPVLGYVGAGAIVLPIEGDVLEEIELPFSAPPDTRALKVRGDSMRPEISDGDFVVYRSIPEDPHILVGKLVIAKLEDGRVLVKRLRRGKDANSFDLESTNAAPIENQRLVWCSRVRSVVFS
ncbi:LexA SOS-response transcriptional repressors (RecA-mediated autopeptidases) [Caulobacteraceae bacterium]